MTTNAKHLAELARAAAQKHEFWPKFDWFDGFNFPSYEMTALVAAASPDVILELCAANEALTADLKHTEECCVQWAIDYGNEIKKVEALTKENAELRADAERYRFIRAGDGVAPPMFDDYPIIRRCDSGEALFDDEADSVIDAARSATP